jgi:glyoxylase-like metal-dependent hydrolase (beta-lactamase superfamily II)
MKDNLNEGIKIMDVIPIKLSVTNCFLLKTGERYVLIDTGYEEDWELFRAEIKKTSVELSQISHIILTHHHDDHCGLLHDILRENASIRVVMSRLCKELIAKGENDQTHGGGLLNKRVAWLIRRKQSYLSVILKKKIDKEKNLKFTSYIVRDCDILIDGDTRLRDIGIPLDGKIIATPGHTVDSISILFDDGDCLPGDAAASMLGFAGTKNCVIFICNMDEYYKSWRKIIAEGAKRIYPAHGKPFPVEKLKTNLGKNKARNLVAYRK